MNFWKLLIYNFFTAFTLLYLTYRAYSLVKNRKRKNILRVIIFCIIKWADLCYFNCQSNKQIFLEFMCVREKASIMPLISYLLIIDVSRGSFSSYCVCIFLSLSINFHILKLYLYLKCRMRETIIETNIFLFSYVHFMFW